jgi:hypothetical protein
MIKPLRKRHLQIWLAWAFLLPMGILFAWLVIPNQAPVKLLQAPSQELLPVIKNTAENENYMLNLRTNRENTKRQLEYINKKPLTVPSAVIFNIKQGERRLVGRIETKGRYLFMLQPDSSYNSDNTFILYDFIHDRIIDSINFTP